ncbi:hypothetical protein [Ruegeria arenilitoris]|uniref:hypothetical protein n=1 Tax=Ruegeria arenilitoris TaxID=1173585 RepID=UPI00147E685B|nr:hypothetical protein [Ruegeria arenilitoris]
MGLEYDFDIVAIAPDEVDPEHALTPVTGAPPVRAQFRDIKTADALRGASPKIRRIFLESGFSLETAGKNATPGFYSPEDSRNRERILKRLFANIRNMGVQGEYCGEFDFWQFLQHVRTARPKAGFARQLRDSPKVNASPATDVSERQSLIGRIGFALGLAVIFFVVIKFLASQGTTP